MCLVLCSVHISCPLSALNPMCCTVAKYSTMHYFPPFIFSPWFVLQFSPSVLQIVPLMLDFAVFVYLCLCVCVCIYVCICVYVCKQNVNNNNNAPIHPLSPPSPTPVSPHHPPPFPPITHPLPASNTPSLVCAPPPPLLALLQQVLRAHQHPLQPHSSPCHSSYSTADARGTPPRPSCCTHHPGCACCQGIRPGRAPHQRWRARRRLVVAAPVQGGCRGTVRATGPQEGPPFGVVGRGTLRERAPR